MDDAVVCAGIVVGSDVAEELRATTAGSVAGWLLLLLLLGTGSGLVLTSTEDPRDVSELDEYNVLVATLVDDSTETVVRWNVTKVVIKTVCSTVTVDIGTSCTAVETSTCSMTAVCSLPVPKYRVNRMCGGLSVSQ